VVGNHSSFDRPAESETALVRSGLRFGGGACLLLPRLRLRRGHSLLDWFLRLCNLLGLLLLRRLLELVRRRLIRLTIACGTSLLPLRSRHGSLRRSAIRDADRLADAQRGIVRQVIEIGDPVRA